MTVTVEATYENGYLKLAQPLPLQEHQKVQVTIHSVVSRARQTAGLMGWQGSAEDAERFARDHDLDVPPLPETP
jgi:predicted DNA-binding antitoxin AbrB/MazE fold protein